MKAVINLWVLIQGIGLPLQNYSDHQKSCKQEVKSHKQISQRGRNCQAHDDPQQLRARMTRSFRNGSEKHWVDKMGEGGQKV